jgi:hypothetical protein
LLFLVGDFNRLNLDKFSANNGIIQIVTGSTPGSQTLDRCYTNRPDIFKCSVINPLMSTDHMALLICDFADYVAPRVHNLPRSRKVIKLFDIREHNIICLNNALERYNWNGILLDSDISHAYTNLTNVLHWFISQFIPVKQVTITDNCPPFVTPLLTSLFRKRNKLMRKNELDKAVALSDKIGKLISEHRSQLLYRVDYRSSKELWASFNPTVKGGSSFNSLNARFGNMFSDLDGINAYFANIAADPYYDSHKIEQIVLCHIQIILGMFCLMNMKFLACYLKLKNLQRV